MLKYWHTSKIDVCHTQNLKFYNCLVSVNLLQIPHFYSVFKWFFKKFQNKTMADSGTSNDDPGGSSTNIMTESDKDKYHHLSKYYELIKITAGKGKPRNLFFKCLQPGPECSTGRAKSCQEGSMSNLLRHYERVHPHLAKDFKKRGSVQLFNMPSNNACHA